MLDITFFSQFDRQYKLHFLVKQILIMYYHRIILILVLINTHFKKQTNIWEFWYLLLNRVFLTAWYRYMVSKYIIYINQSILVYIYQYSTEILRLKSLECFDKSFIKPINFLWNFLWMQVKYLIEMVVVSIVDSITIIFCEP